MSKLILEDGTSRRHHRKRLASLLAGSTGIVRIATAYVTDQQFLSTADGREVRLLTSLDPVDVASGATNLKSLRALIGDRVQCRALPSRRRMHAKVYVFGTTCAVVTSANLTLKGLDTNIEVGVETAAEDVAELVSWFDKLWADGTPVTEEQIARLQRETSALRGEFEKLKKRAKSEAKPIDRPGHRAAWSNSLQDLFETAPRFFVCNTNRRQGARTSTGGFVLEEKMHNRGFAATWEDFNYPTHMERVKPGDVIFMFAKKVGIIAVGAATGE